jgi:branched-chain amino acid transport system ATP-binding protein
LLEVADLQVSYGVIRAVRGLSLRVGAGQTVALIGPNGAGKSTTLLAVAGVLRPVAGSITFEGRRIDGLASETILRRGIALVPEGRRILTTLTVEENLRLAGAHLKRRLAAERIQRMADTFPVLAKFKSKLAGLLSGGEQQQLAIARALMSEPRLLLLDEPSLGLAPMMRDFVYEQIRRLKASGVSVLLVEQDVSRPLSIADRVYVLKQGHLVLEKEASDLYGVRSEVEHAYLGRAGID